MASETSMIRPKISEKNFLEIQRLAGNSIHHEFDDSLTKILKNHRKLLRGDKN